MAISVSDPVASMFVGDARTLVLCAKDAEIVPKHASIVPLWRASSCVSVRTNMGVAGGAVGHSKIRTRCQGDRVLRMLDMVVLAWYGGARGKGKNKHRRR